MKITDPGIIKDGEKDLIDAVKNDLDLDTVKQIIEKKMTAAALSSKGGEIIVHNNEIAFRLDFDMQLSGSLMFDRQGNYIPEANDEDILEEPDNSTELPDPDEILDPDKDLDPDEDPDSNEDLDSDKILEQKEDDNPQDLLAGELDLDDININESLEEVGPKTLLSPTDNNEIDFDDDELNINLPDYGSDDDIENELAEDNLDISEDLNIDDITEDENTDIEMDDHDLLADDLELDPAIEDDTDGDIDDILKESQEFWEQKKDS
jgi:hypothetical protein